jgi:predicted Zn-dependent protease
MKLKKGERDMMKGRTRQSLTHLLVAFMLFSLTVASPAAVSAQKDQKTAVSTQKDQKAAVSTQKDQKAKTQLSTKENPELVGKRNVNKGNWNFYSIDKEVSLGRQLAAQIDQQMRILDDPIVTEYINRIGQNIVLHSDAQVPFMIKVAVSDEINAFALPGGFFYVHTGLILEAENESELAGVMAHEIAHVAARHALENFTKAQLLQYASIPLIFVGGVPGMLGQIGANFGLPLAFFKFNRGAETEADILGAQYTWASGYDPNGLLTFFEKLQAKHKKEPGAFSKLFMTHPSTPDRIEIVKGLLTRFPERDEYVINSWEFNRVKERLGRIQGATKKLDREGEATGGGRPTLKRRHPTDQDQPASEQPPAEKREKPTLQKPPSP